MTKTKFILTILENGETKEYKTMKDIAKDLDIDYHSARAIYANYKQKKKHQFLYTQQLCNKYKIEDNLDYFKGI
jgi:hypothetical protein